MIVAGITGTGPIVVCVVVRRYVRLRCGAVMVLAQTYACGPAREGEVQYSEERAANADTEAP